MNNDMQDNVFEAVCKLELMQTMLGHLINMVEDGGEINTQEKAIHFASKRDIIGDFLHITLDGVFYAIQKLNESQEGGAE